MLFPCSGLLWGGWRVIHESAAVGGGPTQSGGGLERLQGGSGHRACSGGPCAERATRFRSNHRPQAPHATSRSWGVFGGRSCTPAPVEWNPRIVGFEPGTLGVGVMCSDLSTDWSLSVVGWHLPAVQGDERRLQEGGGGLQGRGGGRRDLMRSELDRSATLASPSHIVSRGGQRYVPGRLATDWGIGLSCFWLTAASGPIFVFSRGGGVAVGTSDSLWIGLRDPQGAKGG